MKQNLRSTRVGHGLDKPHFQLLELISRGRTPTEIKKYLELSDRDFEIILNSISKNFRCEDMRQVISTYNQIKGYTLALHMSSMPKNLQQDSRKFSPRARLEGGHIKLRLETIVTAVVSFSVGASLAFVFQAAAKFLFKL